MRAPEAGEAGGRPCEDSADVGAIGFALEPFGTKAGAGSESRSREADEARFSRAERGEQ